MSHMTTYQLTTFLKEISKLFLPWLSYCLFNGLRQKSELTLILFWPPTSGQALLTFVFNLLNSTLPSVLLPFPSVGPYCRPSSFLDGAIIKASHLWPGCQFLTLTAKAVSKMHIWISSLGLYRPVNTHSLKDNTQTPFLLYNAFHKLDLNLPASFLVKPLWISMSVS